RHGPAGETAGRTSRSVPGQPVVATAKVDERMADAHSRPLDSSDEDRVVTLEMNIDGRALEMRERVLEQRQAQLAQRERHSLELVLDLRGGEPARDRLLVVGQ